MDIVEKLEELIKEELSGYRTEYSDGVVDGLLIAIKMIENE